MKEAATIPKLTELVIHDLYAGENLPNMRLSSLKRLIANHPVHEHIGEFIPPNAANLEFLTVRSLRFDRAIVFPNVTELSCSSMDVDMIKAFPAIRRLTVRERITSDFLKSQPAAQMLSLDIRIDLIVVIRSHTEYEEFMACAKDITEMHHLK